MAVATDTLTRTLVAALGFVLVLVGVFVLFTQTPLADWVPVGVVVAIILLVVGVAVMAWSDRIGEAVVVEEHVHDHARPYAHAPATRVRERETTYEDDRF